MNNFFKRTKSSFTLIELMVAIVVLAVIGLMGTHVVEMVRSMTKNGSKLLEAGEQARFVLDRMNLDFSGMPVRTDIDYHFENTIHQKDMIRVISEIYAPQGDRGLSVVGYQLRAGDATQRGLYRAVHGFSWTDSDFMGVDAQGVPPRLMNLAGGLIYGEHQYENIARGVFRVDIAFQKKSDGKIIRDWNQLVGSNTPSCCGITNVGSIVVALAVMDEALSQKISKEDFDLLAQQFPDPSPDKLAIQSWNKILNEELKKKSPKIPISAQSSISFFQRFYPIED